MGINISVYKKPDLDYKVRYEEWDFIRQGHDIEFSGLASLWANKEKSFDEYGDPEEFFRPYNVDEIRAEVKAQNWDDEERYMKLLDLIEKGCWISIN